MKKTIFIQLCLLFVGLEAFAQAPVITSANMFGLKEAAVRYNADTSGINPGAAGANITWDFSMLKPDSAKDSSVTVYESPSITSYGKNFPAADLAVGDQAGNSYSFFAFKNDTFCLIGSENQTKYMGVLQVDKVKYDKPEIVFAFPLTFNTNQANIFHAFNISNGTDTSYHYGTQKVTGDAYGTLKIMNQTYTNVLRLHNITQTTDSIPLPGSGAALIIPSYLESWSYYTPGKKDPMLVISSEGPGSKSVTYNINSKTAGIENPTLETTSLNIYPNPAQNNCTLSFTAQNESLATVKIVNQLGQEISTQNIVLLSGKNTIPLDISGLANGFYIVSINTGSGMAVQRLVVQ